MFMMKGGKAGTGEHVLDYDREIKGTMWLVEGEKFGEEVRVSQRYLRTIRDGEIFGYRMTREMVRFSIKRVHS